MTVELLARSRLVPDLQADLESRYTVHHVGELDAAALAVLAPRIRGLVTGGHLGCDASWLAMLPALELVAIHGVGFDKVDLDSAAARGIRVANTPDVLTDDVADLAIGLGLALCRRLVEADRYARDGRWLKGPMPLGRKFSDRRFGILGLGRIGKALARRLEGFGVEIHYCDTAEQDTAYVFHPTPAALAAAVDVLVVCAAASAATDKIVDAGVLAALGPHGFLVNVARGSIVDEPALVEALELGTLGGAALDVFADEPNIPAALKASDKVVLSPHIASATHETRRAMSELVLANIDAHFAGRPVLTPVV